MWYTYLEQVFIFLKGVMGVIIKTEVRKMLLGHGIFADFLFSQNPEFWAFKGQFSGKKDMADDGTSHVIMFCTLK